VTTTLHDQLARLAERAEPTSGPTGGELWEWGIRYRRRLRTGTAAIAAGTVLGLAVVTGVAIERSGPAPEPAPAGAPAGLPSRIWNPSPWLPGTDEVGMPGRVAAVFETDRGSWTGTGRGVVAVSAATGDYRFLDLPDLAAPSDEVSLSPDGTKVVYWVTGPTSGTPNTYHSDEGLAPAAGIAVLDLVTGEVTRHHFETEHGLWTEHVGWLDDDSVVAQHLQYLVGDNGTDMKKASGTDETIWRWDLSEEEPVQWSDPALLDVGAWDPPVGGLSIVDADERLRVVAGGEVGPVVGRSEWLMGDGGRLLSPDGTRIAGVWGTSGRSPEDVTVVPVGSDRTTPTVQWRLTRASGTFHVDGWIDDDHVAVTRRSEPQRQGYGMGVFAVDVESGQPSLLVRLPEGMFNGVQWATDLLDSPVVDRPAPPRPLDPRWVTAGWVALALGGLLALRGWRRRVTP
jgi:hypothetical protein